MNYLKNSIYLIIILVGSGLFITSCKTKQDVVKKPVKKKEFYMDGKMKFYNGSNLTEAIDFAKKVNKPLFIEFYTEWCLPCKLLSEEVFVNANFAKTFNDNFINYKLDADAQHGADMKFLYNVSSVPTLLFVDHRGRELERIVGTIHQTTLLNSAHHVIQNWESAD